jgi:cellulose biosynthesis protein BcsQ
MALANTACLLAQDEEYPQRVLLWDLDLEAPGLHKLFNLPSDDLRGFVDLAFEAATSNNTPIDLGRYIYSTDIGGIDIFPAGSVGPHYCDKLQRLNWPGFLTADPTERGVFFDEIVSQIAARNYDYVLIDSRTGLNDQAGIATQILPDIVLMIFRLTEQNLDGVTHVYQVTKRQLERRNRTHVRIQPIASMVISKSSGEQEQWRTAVQDLFGEEISDYIRFDADLISDERLFCRKGVKIWPKPPIIDDYSRLCKGIRRRNPEDSKTAFQQLRRSVESGDDASFNKILHRVLASKPRFKKAWDLLFEQGGILQGRLESFDELARSILANDGTNAYAHEWTAYRLMADCLARDNSDGLRKAEHSLGEAIKYAPNNPRLHTRMSTLHAALGTLSAACDDLKTALDLSKESVGLRLQLARLYVRRGRDYFVSARNLLKEIVSESKYPLLAYIDSFLQVSDDGSSAIESIEGLEFDWHRKQQTIAHCLALHGKLDEATRVADLAMSSTDNPVDISDLHNWAELYLCLERYDKVSEILKSPPFQGADSGSTPLIALAAYLKTRGRDGDIHEVVKAWRNVSTRWDFTELLLFRERLIRDNDESYEQCLGVFESIVRTGSLHTLSEYYPEFAREPIFRGRHVLVRAQRCLF